MSNHTNKVRLFYIDSKYCELLRSYDYRVADNSGNKNSRPYIGIMILISPESIPYFAPFTSPKPKHKTMKDTIDFVKIKNGSYGAINLNNMIPCSGKYLKAINVAELYQTNPIQAALVKMQIEWCETHYNKIHRSANALYKERISGMLPPKIEERCVDFKALEKVLQNLANNE